MRKLEFKELKIKKINDEECFYKNYLSILQNGIKQEKTFKKPEKKYEIFYLNILGGKILLLNTDYLPKSDIDNKDLFYNYEIAYKVYNYWLDIYDGIENEQYEFNELYKAERLEKDLKIQKLKNEDDEIFNDSINKFNIIKDSSIYKEYLNLIKENKELKEINKCLLEKINNKTQNKNIGFFQKFLLNFRNKKILKIGENKDDR